MNSILSTHRRTVAALFLGAASLCCAFLAANAEVEKVQKCAVCHNIHNYHTVVIPCNKVNKFLDNHPGDYAGPCQGVSDEKPPKPKKPPKGAPDPDAGSRWNPPN